MLLDEDEILSIIGAELSAADSAVSGAGDHEDALNAYLGDSAPVPAGRSSVVSTDIADAIEWIMPEIMKAFTQNNEVVTFDAMFEGDENQAELESKYTYDILMKDNNGFVVIHQLVKDALIQRNGFVKIFYSKEDETSKHKFTGLTEVEYKMIQAKDGYTVTEETMEMVDGIPIFDITCQVVDKKKKLNVISVPPEEFRVNSGHNSIDLTTARFTAHCMYKSRSDLVKMGYDRDIIDDLPASDISVSQSAYRFSAQGESLTTDSAFGDKSQDLIEIAECYCYIDLDDDGISEFQKITVAGWDTPTDILEIDDIYETPFVSATAILMSHKLNGLSMYDRLKEIQKQKTSLWRNILDNMYLQNNQRTIVVEGQVNLDDLMISRPGGIIRAKRGDAVIPYPTPALSAESYKMMDYLDQTRAGRSGVSPDGSVTDSMIGDRVGSQGIEKMMTAKEELVGLMIRVIAETGIKPICYKIRDEVRRHQDVVRDYMFRGKWVQVDPTKWSMRSNTTVRVGTGSGNRQQQTQTLLALGQQQALIKAVPGQTLVTPAHEYNLLNDIAKLGGFPGAGPYFLDPQSPEGQQASQASGQAMQQEKQKQEEKDMALVKAQVDLANAEMGKAQVSAQLATQKQMTESQKLMLQEQKQMYDAQIADLKQQLDEAKSLVDAVDQDDEMRFKYWDRTKYYKTEEMRIAAQAKAAADNNESKESESDSEEESESATE